MEVVIDSNQRNNHIINYHKSTVKIRLGDVISIIVSPTSQVLEA
jgi:hypothetical protein